MAKSHLSGLRIAAAGRIATNTAATLTIDQETHEGITQVLTRAAGIAVTLPASTGDGARYRFVLGASVTSNSTTIKVANASDIMTGLAFTQQDAGDTVVGFVTGATDDTITWNGTTTGGLKGAWAEIEDIAANLWHVRVFSDASGTEATPFSATV